MKLRKSNSSVSFRKTFIKGAENPVSIMTMYDIISPFVLNTKGTIANQWKTQFYYSHRMDGVYTIIGIPNEV